MIVCHCARITDVEIRKAIEWMRASDPDTIITPGKIYHALGKRPDCGGCLPLFMGAMEATGALRVKNAPPTLRRNSAKGRSSREG